jgi:hypothetical protein
MAYGPFETQTEVGYSHTLPMHGPYGSGPSGAMPVDPSLLSGTGSVDASSPLASVPGSSVVPDAEDPDDDPCVCDAWSGGTQLPASPSAARSP